VPVVMARRSRHRRHADPGRHRGPDRAETLALLVLGVALVLAAVAASVALPFWIGGT
jgi:hypothetical protein